MQRTELVHFMTFVLKVPSFELVVSGTICQLIAVSLKSLLSPLWGSFWLLPVGMRDLDVHTAYVSSWGCRDVNHLQQCLLLLSFKQFQRLDVNHTWQGMFGYKSITANLKWIYRWIILPTEAVKPVYVYHRMKAMLCDLFFFFFCFKLTFLGTFVPNSNSICKVSGTFLS